MAIPNSGRCRRHRRLEEVETLGNSSSLPASAPALLSTPELSSLQAESLTVWTYDDTAWADNLDAWNEQCGSTFWTQHAHNVRWADIAKNIFECKGSMCFKANSNADTCSADCNGGGCTTNLDSFAPMMVYQAMLRADTMIAGGGVMAPLDAVHELEAVKKALTSFSSNLGESTAAKAMVKAQISAVDTMAKSATRFTAAGFVPAFTREFYNTRLVDYIDEISKINEQMLEHARSKDINTQFLRIFRTSEAALNGQAGVTRTMKAQTSQSLTSSIVGMNAAVAGMRQTETLLEEAEENFEKALDAYQKAKRRAAILGLAKALVNPVKRWPRRPSEFVSDFSNAGVAPEIFTRVGSIGYSASLVVNMSVNVFNVVKGCRDLVATDDMTHESIENGLQMLSEDLDMTSDLDQKSTLEELQNATVALNSQLPELGEGFWRQWVSNASVVFNEYLTGYNSAVNSAAQSYVDRLKDQAAFGNDYTTQGYRFVEAVQQLTIYEAMDGANTATASAVQDAQNEISGNDDNRAAAQTILAIKMSTLGMQIETTIQQLCSSYAFQTTGLFDQCVNSPDTNSHANSVKQLCSAATEGRLDFKPLKIAPCEEQFSQESTGYMTQLSDRHQVVKRVNEVVERAMWGNDANAHYENLFVNIELEAWTPAECECQGRFGRPNKDNCDEEWTLAFCNKDGFETSDDVRKVDISHCNSNEAFDDLTDVCCETRQWIKKCNGLEPPIDRPYIRKEAFDRFKDTSDPSRWGELLINLEPQHFKSISSLKSQDEIFVRAAGAYLEGGKVDPDQLLAARLTPVGEMSARIFDNNLASAGDCAAYRASDGDNLCMYRNHSFTGAPSGSRATAMADFKTRYTTPTPGRRSWDDPECASGQHQHLSDVFVKGPGPAELAGGHKWCVPSDVFESINKDFAIPENNRFNSPSLFSSFQLSVYNDAAEMKDKDNTAARQRGVDLADTSKIHLGMWLHTRSRPATTRTCDLH